MNQELGSAIASVAAGQGASNSLNVIGLGREDGLPYLTYQESTGIWHDLGRIKKDDDIPWSALAAGKGSSNSLQVIGLGRENGLPYLIWQDDKGDWYDAGLLARDNNTPWSALVTGNGNANHLQVIGLGREDGLPYLIWQDEKGGWQDAGRLANGNTPWSALVTGNGNSNLLQVVGLGRVDGLPYLIWQDRTGIWQDAGRLAEGNTPWSALAAGKGSSNTLQVIGLGRDDGFPYSIYQDNMGNWHDSGRLLKDNNTPWSALVATRGDGNNLYVIGLGREDGIPYLIWQDDQGVWHDGGQLLSEYSIPWSSLAATTDNSNHLQVIGLGREDALTYLIYQDEKGDRHNYGLLPFGGLKLERPLKPGEVLVYSEENQDGREWLVANDEPNLDRYFPAASFRVGPKTGVTLFSGREYGGLSQNLTAELGSFTGSKLQDQKPKSLKIWLAAGKAFTGYWAIEAAEGRYLSLQSDTNGVGVLSTSPTVSDSEAFRIEDRGQAGAGRQIAAFRVRGTQDGEPLTALQPQPLTIDDLKILTVVDEQEAGFRKFSLLVGVRWVVYKPEEDCFRTSAEARDRTIFHKAIQLAGDESQVGELLQGEVALFENPCYWGKAWVLDKELADFSSVPELSHAVSSIQLGPLTGATIYRQAQYTADDPKLGKQNVVSNIPSLAQEQVGDKQVSSIQMWQIRTPESLNVSFTCSLSQDYRGTGDTFSEYSAYRTTLRLPPTVESVEVWTTDAAEIEVADQTYKVDEDNSVSLSPNPFYSLVITTDAMESPSHEGRQGSLRAPGLVIRTNTMELHDRIVIFPDRGVHERLANLKEDELWNAKFKDEQGIEVSLMKGQQTQAEVANAQSMVTKVMSTVKYTESASGGNAQSIAPEELHGQYWALAFSTYRVNATTLYVREGPGINYKPVGFLRKDDKVEALEFSRDGGWIKLKRPSDGLTGWSSKLYLDNIADRSLSGDRYQVTAAAHLYVRQGPGTEFPVVGAVQNNEIVTAIGVNDTGSWRQICRSDGLVGWSSARYLALVLPPPASENIIGYSFRVTGSLNVRKGPGVNFTTVDYLKLDDIVEALEANADGRWLRVRRTRDGHTGWVSKRYLARLAPDAPDLQKTVAESVAATRLGYGLVPETNFYEMSKESVAEQLANAQSPDTDLAQSWFGDIYNSVKKCVSFVIAEVKQGLAVIINFVDGAVKWIIDTAEKAVALVEGILEKIGVAIEEMIKWLRYLFDWGDILKTRDTINEAITGVFTFVSDQVIPAAQDRVSHFFQDQRSALIAKMDEAITALGSAVKEGTPPSQTSSGNPLGGVSDTVDWVLAKLLPGGNFSLFALDGVDMGDVIGRVEEFENEILMQGFGSLAALPDGLADSFGTLLKNPAEPLKAVADLLNVIRNQLTGLLNLGEEIVNGLLGLLADLIIKFEELISAKISIPFISDILELLQKLGIYSGNTDFNLGFSLLDVTSLILAVPFTAVYKALYGKAPYEGLSSLELQTSDEWILYLSRLGCLSDIVNGLISAGLDFVAGKEAAKAPEAKPEGETNVTATTAGGGTATGGMKVNPFEIASTILSAVSWLPNIYEWKLLVAGNTEPQNDKTKVKVVWSIVDILVFGVDVYALRVGEKRFKRWETGWIIAATLIGVIRIGSLVGWYQEEWPDIVMALPEVASIALLSKNVYVVGFTLVLLDLASSVMAGFNWPVSLQDGLWETL